MFEQLREVLVKYNLAIEKEKPELRINSIDYELKREQLFRQDVRFIPKNGAANL